MVASPTTATSSASRLPPHGSIAVASSRVHRGSIALVYAGPGGGRELVAAGAISTGWMRRSQARIAPIALFVDRNGHRNLRDALISLVVEPAAAQPLQL